MPDPGPELATVATTAPAVSATLVADVEVRRAPGERRLRVRDLPRHWAVIRVLAARDMKVKFKQSLLGPIWLFVQPVALLGAFVVGFGGVGDVKTAGVPYALFALVGLSAWTFFQVAVNMGSAALVTNYFLVRRTACPRIAFPISSLIANLPSLAIPLIAALVFSIVDGQASARMLALPGLILWLMVLTAGVTCLLATIAVRFRDVLSALPLVMQVGIFVSPVGYPAKELPHALEVAIWANPMTGIMEAWRWAILSSHPADLAPICVGAGATALVAWLGWLLFVKVESVMADII